MDREEKKSVNDINIYYLFYVVYYGGYLYGGFIV